jgi:hypothetical protein
MELSVPTLRDILQNTGERSRQRRPSHSDFGARRYAIIAISLPCPPRSCAAYEMMIPHILLTGAGFSHNWGGYLAKEAFDYLLGVTEFDEDLRSVLWADQAKGFEATLARLRKEYEENYSPQVEQDFNNMTTAVRRMFGDMWLAFGQSKFDEQFDDPRLGVIRFLTRFDAIFTLNQDTLLESHYLPMVDQTDFAKNAYQGPRNIGAHRPGARLSIGHADLWQRGVTDSAL